MAGPGPAGTSQPLSILMISQTGRTEQREDHDGKRETQLQLDVVAAGGRGSTTLLR